VFIFSIVNIASLVASCNTNKKNFGAEIYNPQKKKSAKIKCLLFRPKPQKFHTAEITDYTVLGVILVSNLVMKEGYLLL
jgi:hypothetical protein